MSFDWGDFLKIAEILHEGASTAKLEEASFALRLAAPIMQPFAQHEIGNSSRVLMFLKKTLTAF